jgi:hypothetical protein
VGSAVIGAVKAVIGAVKEVVGGESAGGARGAKAKGAALAVEARRGGMGEPGWSRASMSTCRRPISSEKALGSSAWAVPIAKRPARQREGKKGRCRQGAEWGMGLGP